MEDMEILNQGEQHPDHQDLAEFILSHQSLEESKALLVEIAEHIAAAEGLSVAIEAIALEGVVETIKTYWAKFVAFLKKIWEKIVKFFELHFTTLGRQRLHINRMMKKIKSISTNPGVYQSLEKNGRMMKLGESSAQSFVIQDKECTNFAMLAAGLEQTKAAVKMVTEDYSKHISDRGTLISQAMITAIHSNAQGILARITEELEHAAFSHSPANMLGNVTVKYGSGEQGLDSYRLVLQERKATGLEGVFKYMTIEELAKIYLSMESILDNIDTFKDGEYKEIIARANELMANSDKFVKSVGQGEGEGNAAAYHELLAMNKHYLNWIKAPTTDVIRHLTTTFFHISLEAEDNINQFQQQGARNLFTVLGLMP